MQNQTIILMQTFQSASSRQVDFSLCLGKMRTGCEKHLGEKEAGACQSDSQMDHQEYRLLSSKRFWSGRSLTAASTACFCALESVTENKPTTLTCTVVLGLKDNAE